MINTFSRNHFSGDKISLFPDSILLKIGRRQNSGNNDILPQLSLSSGFYSFSPGSVVSEECSEVINYSQLVLV